MIEAAGQDVRYGLRMLRRNPGFTLVAVFALGLGIGINTAVLTVYRSMVARPLQARDPSRMVNLALLHGSGQADYTFSYPDYEAYRDSMRSLDGLIATNHEQLRLSAGEGIAGRATSSEES